MGVESRAELSIKPGGELVTCLPLFKYGGPALDKSRLLYSKIKKFSDDCDKSKAYWDPKEREFGAILERQSVTLVQTSYEVVNHISSVTAATAYLKFLDEFDSRGISPKQVFDFFKLCLMVNTSCTLRYEVSNFSTEQVIVRGLSSDFMMTRIAPIYQKASKNVPEWFHSNSESYLFFLDAHASFRQYLNPHISTLTMDQRINDEKLKAQALLRGENVEMSLGPTVLSCIPDWAYETNHPDRHEVEKELAADKKELELLTRKRTSLIRSSSYLRDSFNEKHGKNMARFIKRWDELKGDNLTLGDFLSYLSLDLADDPEDVIRQYSKNKNRLIDSEAIALWIEENFRVANLVKNGIFTEGGREVLDLLFSVSLGSESDEAKNRLNQLKSSNKKTYRIIHFKLEPLTSLLSSEDIELLDEFLEDQNGLDVGSFISFFADVLVSRLNTCNKENFNPDLKVVVREFGEFYAKFLRHNWKALFRQFEPILFGKDKNIEQLNLLPGSTFENDEETTLTHEEEEELSQIREGNLFSWKVQYAINQTSDPTSLVEIEGDSLDDKDRKLSDLFVRLGVSNSIKISSVVNAIDWKTQNPKDVEQIVPAMIVKGERWKKIKRGSVRILYQMDPESKVFIFFVHQKKDWSYNLPAA